MWAWKLIDAFTQKFHEFPIFEIINEPIYYQITLQNYFKSQTV